MERQDLEDRIRELELRLVSYRLDELKPLLLHLNQVLGAWGESYDHFHRLVTETENLLQDDRAAIENVRDALRTYRSEQGKQPWWKKVMFTED